MQKKVITLLILLAVLEAMALTYVSKTVITYSKNQQYQIQQAASNCKSFSEILQKVIDDKYVSQRDYITLNRYISGFYCLFNSLENCKAKNYDSSDISLQILSIEDICSKMYPDKILDNDILNALQIYKVEEFAKICDQYLSSNSLYTVYDWEKFINELNDWCADNSLGTNNM